jgi:tRNA(Ile)-lysidine synthase
VLPGQLIIVAVSGGQDSTCLLDVLHRYAARNGVRLHVAHVDHRLRGRESAEDSHFVARRAASYGLPFTPLAPNVAEYRRAHRLSTQVAARFARYQVLGRLAAELRADAVATGHTRDDLVETMLLNLVRGTGLRGLAGLASAQALRLDRLGPPIESDAPFPEGSSLWIVRPLIEVERRQTANYCHEASLTFRADPSNARLDYRRNRVRAELVPLLERLNPAIRTALATTAHITRQDLAIVDQVVESVWRDAVRRDATGINLDLPRFQAEPAAIRRHLLRRAVRELVGSADGLNYTAIESALELIEHGRPGERVPLMRLIAIELEANAVRVRLVAAPGEPSRSHPPRVPTVQLPVPGCADLGQLGKLEVHLIQEPPEVAETLRQLRTLPPNTAALDADRLGATLLVRARRPGDRMQPLGMHGSKKVQDILVDAAVPRQRRDAVPIVEASGTIAWLAGLRVDRRFGVDEHTRRISLLQFSPSGDAGC